MLDLDPRDYDSRDEERHANTRSGGGRGSSADHDRDHDWRQPDARTRDRDVDDARSLGRGPGNDRQGSDVAGRDRDHDPRWTNRDRDTRDRDPKVRDAFSRHVHLPPGRDRELVHDRDREYNRLVRRGLAGAIPCVHNRARLYHVHARVLYTAIGEGSRRHRRPVPAGRPAERLMLLDAGLTTPDLDWLTTAAEKRACVARLSGSTSPEPASDPPADPPPAAVRDLPGTLPIGLDANGRVVLLYLATDPWTDRFRTFLQGHARLLRVAPTWTIRLAFPHPLEHFYSACQAVIHDELESPLHPATIGELQWFFEHRRQSEAAAPLHPMTKGFLNVGYKVFGTPRFTEMYQRWRRYGDAVVLPFINTVAFGRRCIPAAGVAPPSNTPGIIGRRALAAGRLAALGASPYL